ncbi:MAG: NTP transferase domain-containing protein [Gemmatimonadetes bacterium]|nr:NTP transferase domain-containing protein [Gemmatimonadota bacterium]
MTPPPLTLVILAAGRSTRFGRLKQLTPIGPGGEALLDYALHDSALAGFTRFVLVIQEDKQDDFDAHLAPAVAAGLDICYVYQRLAHPGLVDDPPSGRTRPWGTGHAVLTAAERISGSFALCNADDFYGRAAYAALALAIRDGERVAAPDPLAAFMIGYPLEVTLSESGGVSRGICEVDGAGTLQRLAEGFEMRRSGNRVRGRDVAGRPVDVPLDTPVCTNLWGFPEITGRDTFHDEFVKRARESGHKHDGKHVKSIRNDKIRDDFVNTTSRLSQASGPVAGSGILDQLHRLFSEFLASGPGLDREFYLTEAVNDLIAAGLVHCKVLPTRERWLGVTFPDDHSQVAESLRSLVDSGVYPMRLWDAPPTLPHQG